MLKEERKPKPLKFKFQCQESCGGGCCKIPEGQQLFIFLTRKDRERLAAFLKKPFERFARKSHFASTRFGGKGWHWHLKTPQGAKQCRFLVNGRCSVYEARPTQCKTWPYWPENMNAKTQEYFMTVCPGIGVGPELPDAEVKAQLTEQKEADAVYSSQIR